jgi:hypothetical protein
LTDHFFLLEAHGAFPVSFEALPKHGGGVGVERSLGSLGSVSSNEYSNSVDAVVEDEA